MESGSSSSSSSGSTSTSGSSSCTDTGSSSETESSSSGEEKTLQNNSNKNQTTTRRKSSSDFKAGAKSAATTGTENEKLKVASGPISNTASKVRAATAAGQRNCGGPATTSADDDDENDEDDDDVQDDNEDEEEEDDDEEENEDVPPIKKTLRATNATTAAARRKTSISNASASAAGGGGGGGGGNATVATAIATPTSSNKTKQSNQVKNARAKENGERKHAQSSDESIRESRQTRKMPNKMTTTATTVRAKQLRSKISARRVATTAAAPIANSNKKSSDSSDVTESGSGTDTSTVSDSEETDSTNSYSSQQAKHAKKKVTSSKMQRSDTDEERATTHPIRKLTRSLSMRRPKQKVKQGGSDSDSDTEIYNDKHSYSRSPTKKPATMGLNNSNNNNSNSNANKCKVKKECNLMPIKTRPLSPAIQTEKKCPVEGCDSSGHLSGNLDRHFLPEACPIYHNMSASECKERANERKLRNEQRHKLPINMTTTTGITTTGAAGAASKILTPEQKEFLAKIRESRAKFRPINNNNIADKVKLEKDCTDEDREPNLTGLVPDYDLQLFRDAQALASEKIEDELKDLPVGKGIKYITMGKYKMKVWYQSPYPDDAARLPKMYICEFCLRYQKSETGIKRHAQKCVWRHPPGDEIYRKGKLQVWQVDGKRYKQYCQHLCLLAKFFLDHKTLYYDVEPFLFYIMTLADVDGCHTVGYFSKEKNSFYNVSCILTLPPYQRKGYGRLLIDFSYLLTRVEGKIGSPEKPLSDLGLISYRSYWKDVLLDYLCNRTGNTLTIKDVSQEMAIYSYDIVSTLQALGMMKYWKGKHIVLKKQDVLDEYEERVKRRGTFPKIDDSCLRWQPFVPTQMNASP